MQDIEKLLQGEKGDALRGLAKSEEALKLSKMVDVKEIEKAAAEGNMEALRAVVASVLQTEEGRKLAERIRKL